MCRRLRKAIVQAQTKKSEVYASRDQQIIKRNLRLCDTRRYKNYAGEGLFAIEISCFAVEYNATYFEKMDFKSKLKFFYLEMKTILEIKIL